MAWAASESAFKAPFLLASNARFLYPVGCLACERPPAVIWAGQGA